MNVSFAQEFNGMTSRSQMAFGLSVLLVEDHALIALDLETMLLDLGAGQVTIATTANQALDLIAAQIFDVAFLDVRLGDAASLPVAIALRDKGIPFAVASGYDTTVDISEPFKTAPLISKPYSKDDIAAVWQTLVGTRCRP